MVKASGLRVTPGAPELPKGGRKGFGASQGLQPLGPKGGL